ncbi:MAG TPA: alpha-L-arabinofuranosidase C-terminal domain-containing protein [Chitinophaga sp.]
MKKKVLQILALGLLAASGVTEAQHNNVITVNTKNVSGKISPTMWGVFFEDINMGADGGIYAELIKNRSFEFFRPLMGWTVNGTKVKEGDMLILHRSPSHTANPRFLRATVSNAAQGDAGLLNEGFRGMGIKQGLRYDFSVLYRQQQPGVRLHIQLLNSSAQVIGDTLLTPSQQDTIWHKQSVSFHATATEPKATLQLWLEGSGTIDLDMISLFPEDTWKRRPGGMRADMIQLLADMKPGFIRFPGGCIVEGFDLSQRYQWKKTIGPVEERQLIINRWNFEFAHRPTPDYFQTFGLGFFEYFQLAQDIGAEPLPILNCGMACQFNSAELVPLDELDPYIQDALDLIEFANGDTTTTWGRVRANMGHPAPFHLKLMGVGNENWGPQYIERLKLFTKAIKEKYPNILLVNSAGTDPNGERFDYLDKELRNMHADIIDEHYYRSPQWFLQNARRYDNYPRNGSKIFAGEYAAQSDKMVSIHNKNNWLTALSEAAFMTGLERNADVVSMASYAPLFAHTDGWQWTPDLIWVDNLRSFGTPNYYVQQLFSLNKGTAIVPLRMGNDVIAGQDSLYASAALDEKNNELIIKLVNVSGLQQTCTLELDRKPAAAATLTVLQSNDPGSVNSFDQPGQVSPESREIKTPGKRFPLEAAPYSLNVLRIPV